MDGADLVTALAGATLPFYSRDGDSATGGETGRGAGATESPHSASDEGGFMMGSRTLMIALGGFYLLIEAAAGYERNWPIVLYWLSAASILLSVLWMRGAA